MSVGDLADDMRAAVAERERAWRERMRLCSCLHPVPGRCYLGRWSCARCGQVTRPRWMPEGL